MKIISIICLLSFSMCIAAQEPVQYVAIRGGLNMRAKAGTDAVVLEKIPYGTKIVLEASPEEMKPIQTEGLNGMWRKVRYNNKTGYIVDSYLFPVPPPKPGTRELREWLGDITTVHGTPLVVNGNNLPDQEAAAYRLTKQLYKSGAELHEYGGYEYSSKTYFIPEFTVQQGFLLLLRLLPEFADYVGEKDEFVSKNKVVKKGDREYKYTVDKELLGNTPWIKKIKIEFDDGAIYDFELYQIDNQLVIFYGAGV